MFLKKENMIKNTSNFHVMVHINYYSGKQLGRDVIEKIYRKMTLLRTMDKILYDSQRKVIFLCK